MHTSVARGCSFLVSFLAVLGPTPWCSADEQGTGSAFERTEFTLAAEEPQTLTIDEVAALKSQPPATAADSAVETGTDPSKLLFRFEMNPQYIELPGDGHLASTNFKLDVPLTKSFAMALELPIVHASGFPSPIDNQVGLGDIFVRARNVWSFERSSFIAGAELGLMTADDDLLGSGKWQLNPTLAYVHYLSSEYLLAVAGKQRLSIAGDDDRADINQTELRLIGIYINPKGWWLQADYQPKINWERDGQVSHLLEFEAGTMLSRSIGVSIRPGVGIGPHSDRDWSIGVGLRFFF
jgi:hypothetical protein